MPSDNEMFLIVPICSFIYWLTTILLRHVMLKYTEKHTIFHDMADTTMIVFWPVLLPFFIPIHFMMRLDKFIGKLFGTNN